MRINLANFPSQPALPFALDKLTLFAGCTQQMYAWIRYAAGSQAGDTVTKLDIDLLDHQGHVCVQIKGMQYDREQAALESAIN